jgi:hypothetical protein
MRVNTDRSGIPEPFRLKFPGLRAIQRPPPLAAINGTGLALYGKRDFDSETGTSVKTLCLGLFSLPLFALGAYRVAEADGSWRFIGKDRLSAFAAGCNVGVLVLLLMLGGVVAQHFYRTSPEYRAQEAFRQAESAVKLGDLARAAALYLQVAEGGPRAMEGRHYLQQALDLCLSHPDPDQVEAGVKLIASLPIQLNVPAPVLPDALPRGAAAVERFRTNNPGAALAILRQLQALGGPAATALKPLEIEVLLPIVAAHPEDTNRVMELALAYEEERRVGECVRLLTPYQDRLGSTEGARILGHGLIAERKYDEAISLLSAYVRPRLPGLSASEGNFTNAVEAAYRRAYHELKEGRADPAFLEAYRQAAKPLQTAMLDQFVEKYTREDATLQRVLAESKAANRTVQAALDLGLARLSRAQSLTDAPARKAELEAAESGLLAVRAQAGETDAFRVFLGQIDYLLGKHKDGQQLFDQLLAAHQRAPAMLLSLAPTLRELGEENQARALAEEAYRTSGNEKEKFAAAWLRVHLRQDLEDELVWLEKCNPGDAEVVVEINTARGNVALRDGDRPRGAQFLRQAIAGYEKMPPTSVTLNNWGLACLNLYHATGDLEVYNQSLTLLERSIALAPAESVQLLNIAHLLATRAYMDVIGQAIRFEALQAEPDSVMLLHLCPDDSERARLLGQLRQNEHLRKALVYLDKALLLAPKSPLLYSLGLRLQSSFRDLAELQKLQRQLQTANPDLAETLRSSRDAYGAGKDKERLDRAQNEIRRYEALRQSPAVQAHAPTLEFAEATLNSLRQSAGLKGAAVNSEKILADALALYQRHPTGGSLSTAASACFFRADEDLKQQNADYARLAELTRRALTPRELMALLLERESALAPLIRQNTNVVKALELVKEITRRFPSSRGIDEWALLRTLDPAEAALAMQQLNEDKAGRLADEMQFQLNPLSASAILKQYWARQLNGDQSAAAQLYQQALRDGVPLPPP